MSQSEFVLDPRLAADTHPVASLPLCEVLLMNDARYTWLVLVPRHAHLSEIHDLADADQAQLWREVNRAAAALGAVAPCDKPNPGPLGNTARPLPVHVVVRRDGDPNAGERVVGQEGVRKGRTRRAP